MALVAKLKIEKICTCKNFPLYGMYVHCPLHTLCTCISIKPYQTFNPFYGLKLQVYSIGCSWTFTHVIGHHCASFSS